MKSPRSDGAVVDLTTGQLAVVESAEETAGWRSLQGAQSRPQARTVSLSTTVMEELRAHRVAGPRASQGRREAIR